LMYMGYNKIDISVLCCHCRNKKTDVHDLTVEEIYYCFYTDPRFSEKRNNHQMINSIIVSTLLAQHDCYGCLTKIYAFG
jgi:hypothetical protein